MDDILKFANEFEDDGIDSSDNKHLDLTSYFNYVTEETTLKRIGKELGDKLAENFSQKQIDAFIYQIIEGAKNSYEIQKHDMITEDKIGQIFEDVEPSKDADKARERLVENNLSRNSGGSVLDHIDPDDLL